MTGSPYFPAPIMPDTEKMMRRIYEGVRCVAPAARATIQARFDSPEAFCAFRSFPAAMQYARHSASQKYRKGPGQKMPAKYCSECCTRLRARSGTVGQWRGDVPASQVGVADTCDHCLIAMGEAANRASQ